MTREEVKRRLLNIERSLPNTFRTKEDVRNFEALEMAIKALEQEPTDDYFRKMAEVVISQLRTDRDRLEDELAKLEQEPSGDLISREDRLVDLANAIESDNSGYWTNKRISSALRNIKDSSPVNPQEPKTGHWLVRKEKSLARCSNCKFLLKDKDEIKLFDTFVQGYNFCPYCGCKMEREEV